MPELPEVETILQGLQPQLHNEQIVDVEVRCVKLRLPITLNLKNKLLKQKILSLMRRGKYLLIKLTHGTLIIHLGMSGRLFVVNHGEALRAHDHVDIILSNGKILRYNDARRFVIVLWTKDDPYDHVLLRSLGLEPFDIKCDAEYLMSKAQNRRMAIKSFIMNSNIVVGIGNIYAAECLFAAKIHPLKAAGELTLKQYEDLILNIKQILQKAIQHGGTTIKDFVNGMGKPGYFAQKLQVYGRGGEKCYDCSSALQNIKISQRMTIFCNHCQV